MISEYIMARYALAASLLDMQILFECYEK